MISPVPDQPVRLSASGMSDELLLENETLAANYRNLRDENTHLAATVRQLHDKFAAVTAERNRYRDTADQAAAELCAANEGLTASLDWARAENERLRAGIAELAAAYEAKAVEYRAECEGSSEREVIVSAYAREDVNRHHAADLRKLVTP